MKILIIGGGNMGLTFAKSFLATHIVTNDGMCILEKSVEKAQELSKMNIGTIYGEPSDFIKQCDLIILAVKPQDSQELFKKIKSFIDPQQVILSIMAGVRIETIQNHLGNLKIVRAMPNLPAQIGVGMTVFTSSNEVTRIELVTVQNLISATGKAIYVEDENMIDAATAVSGSGPAYVFYFMDALIKSAQELGFNKAESELLSYQTFKGAIELFNTYDFSCEEWIKKVMSKGGTTEAAFQLLNANTVQDKFKEGVHGAYTRAKELSLQ
jgi:pyrroline-5-carboxylate reductase